MKSVVVMQSNYLPWKGYFDLVHDADLFIFYDDLQYTKNDWRNRNRIKAVRGAEWLTVPVGADCNRLICEVAIKDTAWQAKHWKILLHNYGTCPHFARYRPWLEDHFLGKSWSSLSDMNQVLVQLISSECLGITTEFQDSRQYSLSGQKQDRLLDLLIKAGAERYISGPAAKSYIDPMRFSAAGIQVVWKDYSGYPEYPQRYPPFDHAVSILDLLFNVGPDAAAFIWGWRRNACAK